MAEASGGAAGNTLPNFKAPREREEPGKNQNDLPTRTAVATRASYRRLQALVELLATCRIIQLLIIRKMISLPHEFAQGLPEPAATPIW